MNLREYDNDLLDLFVCSDKLLQVTRLLSTSYFEAATDENGRSINEPHFSGGYEVMQGVVGVILDHVFEIRNGLDKLSAAGEKEEEHVID